MALLIVTRSMQLSAYYAACEIIIDDARAAQFGARRILGIELPPGQHQIMARVGRMQSDVVPFEAGPDSERRFHLGTRLRTLHVAIASTPPIWMIGAMVATRGDPDSFLLALWPALVLSVIAIAYSIYLTSHGGPWLFLTPLPASLQPVGVSGVPVNFVLRYSDLPPPTLVPPVRLHFSLRGIMIAVAIVAVLLWLGVGGFRTFRQAQYRNNANMHAANEAVWRLNERRQNEIVHSLERMNLDSRSIRKSAVRSAARADYHEAMRRKYERAAALGLLSVDPDPPEPRQP